MSEGQCVVGLARTVFTEWLGKSFLIWWHLSRDLEEVRERVSWIPEESISSAERAASAKALR